MNKSREIFVLIDSNALIHRAYHAYPSTLTTSTGEQINAVFGFASMLLRVLEDLEPTYIACAFDMAKPTFRHLEYQGYKADRRAPDKELIPQFDRARELVDALNIPLFQVEGYEADDVIGTLCRQIDQLDPENQVQTIIVTGDKDALQLVDANTRVWLPGKSFKDMKLYDAEMVMERFGLEPKQIIDLKAIAGDPSDQIPGVKGIGDKGAVSLLQEFGSVENIYEKIEEVPNRYKNKLVEEHDSAVLSKMLATIVTEVPITLDYDKAVLADYDYQEAFDFFRRMEFRSLINKLPKSIRKGVSVEQMGIFTEEKKADKKTSRASFKELVNLDNIKDLVKDIDESGKLAFSVIKDHGVLISESEDKPVSFIPFNLLDHEEIKNAVQEIFGNSKSTKIGYSIKRDLHALDAYEIEVRENLFDVRLAAYLLGFSGGNLELKSLAFSQVGIMIEDLKKEDERYLDNEVLKVQAVSKMYGQFLEDLEKEDEKAGEIWRELIEGGKEEFLTLPDYRIGAEDLFYKLEMPLVSILKKMEEEGIAVDKKFLEDFGAELASQIEQIEKKIFELVGHEFNAASSRQLADVLFEELKLPAIKKTKTGYSTAAPVLAELRGTHPIIEEIERFRELSKIKSTYIDGLIPLIQEDGRIHTSYNQSVVVTGRLSSSNPNLQNIPIRTEVGNKIRKAFITPEDAILVALDYSQIELRIAAHVAQEEKMLKAFASGEDIHAATAAEIFELSVEKVTKSQRRIAKTVNFAVLYGVSAYGLSRQLGNDPKEAAEIIELYFEKYPKIYRYIEKAVEVARKYEEVETMFGRRAIAKNINSSSFQASKAAERFAINFPMQGTAADIMKLSMIEVDKVLKKLGKDYDVKMLLQVHDELVFEYREEGKSRGDLIGDDGEIKSQRLKGFIESVDRAMEGVVKLSVPLSVEAEVGSSWGAMKDVK